jgi:hypothetical protein
VRKEKEKKGGKKPYVIERIPNPPKNALTVYVASQFSFKKRFKWGNRY